MTLAPDPDDPETVDLTDEQRQRARAALRAVEEDIASRPSDLLDEWKRDPDTHALEQMGFDFDCDLESTGEQWVPVDRIVGIDHELIDRFEKSRMTNALELLVEGRFCPRYEGSVYTPHYREICGDYYVCADGTHRSMACKVTGVEEIHGRVDHVDVNESDYQEWVDRRDRGPASDESDTDTAPEYRGPIDRLRDWLDRFR